MKTCPEWAVGSHYGESNEYKAIAWILSQMSMRCVGIHVSAIMSIEPKRLDSSQGRILKLPPGSPTEIGSVSYPQGRPQATGDRLQVVPKADPPKA
jgi:hypothetical protein